VQHRPPQTDAGVQIAAFDPVASMAGAANPDLTAVAEEVRLTQQAVACWTAARETP